MHLKSKLLTSIPGIEHGFGSRNEPMPRPFENRWEELKPRWKQNHGTSCIEVKAPSQECGEVDALYSRQASLPIAVVTADCVPVLMARKDGAAVAAIHAGWRGTEAQILRQLWTQLESQGESPSEWVAAIGPAVGPCCYEVSEELAEKFTTKFANLGHGLAVPQERHLDLPAINKAELELIGLAQVDLLRACTMCSQEPDLGNFKFFSYRREGKGTRQWSVISRS